MDGLIIKCIHLLIRLLGNRVNYYNCVIALSDEAIANSINNTFEIISCKPTKRNRRLMRAECRAHALHVESKRVARVNKTRVESAYNDLNSAIQPHLKGIN